MFDALIAEQSIPEPILHVFLSSSNDDNSSFFEFGAVNESVVDGPWHTVPMSLVQPALGYWMIDVDNFTVGEGPSIEHDEQFWGIVECVCVVCLWPRPALLNAHAG